MAVLRQRRPDEMVVNHGNSSKRRTLADVIKTADSSENRLYDLLSNTPIPVAYSTVAADLAAALVNAGLMEPQGGG